MADGEYEPRILGFLCNWCSYAGADLSGVSRIQYPSNLRVIRVMCSGRVDPVLVFKAFAEGIDGVAVLGCHPGDCHYQSGNYQAIRKMDLTMRILDKVGIGRDRMILDWVSAAEGQRFAGLVTEFTESIKKQGPISQIEDLRHRAALGGAISEAIRIRWLVGKEEELLEKGNVYGEKVDPEQYHALLDLNISKEYDRQVILSQIRGEAKTVAAVSEAAGMPKDLVFKYLTQMENAGQVALGPAEGRSPTYILAQTGGEC